MKKQIFDERQISIQRRHSSIAFLMLLFILVVNTIFKYYSNCNYISTVNELTMVVFLPLTYFSVATVLTGSYTSFSNNKKINMIVLVDLVMSCIIFIGWFLYLNGFSEIVQNGIRSHLFSFPIWIIYFFVIIIAHIIKFKKDKKEEN